MDRKPGITFLSIIMWFNSINILGGFNLLLESSTNIDVVVGVLVVVSNGIAGIAGYGLWSLKTWAHKSLIIYLYSLLITNIFIYMPEEANHFHWSVWIALLIANVLLIYKILAYVNINTNNYSNKSFKPTPKSGAV